MSIEQVIIENTAALKALTAAIASAFASGAKPAQMELDLAPAIAICADVSAEEKAALLVEPITQASLEATAATSAPAEEKKTRGRPRKNLNTGEPVVKNMNGDPIGTMYWFVPATDSIFVVKPTDRAIHVDGAVTITGEEYVAHQARLAAKMVQLQQQLPEVRYFKRALPSGDLVLSRLDPSMTAAEGAVEIAQAEFDVLWAAQEAKAGSAPAANVSAAVETAMFHEPTDTATADMSALFGIPSAPPAAPAGPAPITYKQMAERMLEVSRLQTAASRAALLGTLADYKVSVVPDLQKDADIATDGTSVKFAQVLAALEAKLAA